MNGPRAGAQPPGSAGTSPASLDLAALGPAIAATLSRMGHLVQEYPILFRPPAGYEIVPAVAMIDTANLGRYFERAIRDWTDDPTIEDQRAAASRFMRRYLCSVVIASLVPLLNGIAFDVTVPRVRFVISQYPGQSNLPMGVVLDAPEEVLGATDRQVLWPIAVDRQVSLTELRARAVSNLIVDHVRIVIERVLEVAHVSPRLLWSTVAEAIEGVYEGYFERRDPATTAEEYARADADREAILLSPELPGVPGPSPVADLIGWETIDDPRFPRPVAYRRVCCVNFVIPSRPRPYCVNCPLLSYEERGRLRKAEVEALATRYESPGN